MDDLSSRRRKLSLGAALLLLLLLALPRAARIASSRAWAEDEQFFAAAELVRRGAEPYRDFVHVNLPLLEQMLAGAFALFGTTLHTAELFTALFALLGTLALARLSVAGALLLATSALLFRYHVFEREVVYASAGAIAWALSPHAPIATRRGALAVGALLGFGVAVKISAGAALGAYLAWMLLYRRGGSLVAIVALLGALPFAAIYAFYRWRVGEAVDLQLFAFLLAKGTNAPTLGAKLELLRVHLEPLVWLALAWLVGAARAWPGRGASCFALLWIGTELVANVLLKTTIWPHNLLPLLFPLAYFAGRSLEAGIDALRRRGKPSLRGALGAGVALSGLVWYAFVGGARWTPPSSPEQRDPARTLVHGFGGLLRSDLDAVVSAVDAQPRDMMFATSDWLPALCGAEPLYRFWESHGVYRELERAAKEGRLEAHLQEMRRRSFEQRLAETLPEYLPDLDRAMRVRSLRFLVSTNGEPLGPVVGLPPAPRTERYGPLVVEVLR
ncbi:MAG: hypothetical protein IPN34_05425 [Planctomycetes bacterium]|nr:hypothetical protein [Planctomycetota bacterium]